jgi:hypothetical protein
LGRGEQALRECDACFARVDCSVGGQRFVIPAEAGVVHWQRWKSSPISVHAAPGASVRPSRSTGASLALRAGNPGVAEWRANRLHRSHLADNRRAARRHPFQASLIGFNGTSTYLVGGP